MSKSVEFNGKVIRYTTYEDLAKKIRGTVGDARRLAQGSTTRYVIDNSIDDIQVEKIDLKKEFRGMLARRFGIRKTIANRELIGQRKPRRDRITKNVRMTDLPVNIDVRVGRREYDIVDRIPENKVVQVFVKARMYFMSMSGMDCNAYNRIQAAMQPDENGMVNRKYGYGNAIDMARIIDAERAHDHKHDRKYRHRPIEIIRRERTFEVKSSPANLQNAIFQVLYGNGITCEANLPKKLRRYKLDPNTGWVYGGVVGEYTKLLRDAMEFLGYDYSLRTFNNKSIRLKDMILREEIPLKLSEWVNIEYSHTEGPDSCVVNFIAKRFPSLSFTIKKMVSSGGVTVGRFMELLKSENISYAFYSEHGKELYQHISEQYDGMVNAIIYNNHVYPTCGGPPRRERLTKPEDIITDDAMESLEAVLSEGILPKGIMVSAPPSITLGNNPNVSSKDIVVRSFVHDNARYIGNDEYMRCVEYMEKYGVTDLKPSTMLTDLPMLIEKACGFPDCRSFIPDIARFKTAPLLRKTTKPIDESRLVTVDKNKCYPCALANLPYLIKFDYRKNAIRKNPSKIIAHNMYVAEPEVSTILMPVTKLYAGYFLKKCASYGLRFKLLEELECEVVNNYYRTIINDLINRLEVPMDEFKVIMNVAIGKFERAYSEKDVVKYVGIYTEEAAMAQDGYHCDIGDYKLLFKNTMVYSNVRSKLPIATQVKDESRMMIYEKIRELNLSDDQIVQINTDSISYYGKLPTGLDADDFNGWKSSSFNALGNLDDVVYDDDITLLNLPCVNPNPRILHMKYAGAGKTTHIIKELVPRLIAEGKSYIVLTPTHKTLTEYQRDNIRCEVIQKYIFSGTIPDEEYVIVDEVGFITLECHDVLYKIVQAGKSLECFGDFKQLPPVDEPYTYDQPHYLNYMFTEIDTDYTNYRNTFTTEYYDSLINSDKKGFLIKEIKKHSTALKHAPRVICYRHDTRRMYNKKIMNMLGLPTWDVRKGHTDWDPTDIDIMCVKDGLRHKGICNRSEYTVIYCDAKKVTIVPSSENKMDLSNPIKITFKQLHTYFEPSYAINVHQAQGLTLDSYHWAAEDDKFVTNRIAYVVISRLRQVAE